MNCPLCVERRLEPVIVDGVEIDVCENCGGVWLDRGELDRMARPAPAEPQVAHASPASKPPKGSKSGGGKKPKKQKSLGSRLGDLLEEALDL